MNKKENMTPSFMFTQGMFWMTYCVVGGFTSSYLIGKGYSNTMVGIVIAASAIISAVLQVILADFADHSKKISAKHILLALALLTIASCVGIVACSDHLGVLHIIFTVAKTLLYMCMPFLSTIGIESINQGKELNYGLCRGIGSLTYAVMIFGLGRVIESRGVDVIPWVAIICAMILSISVAQFKFVKVPLYTGDRQDRPEQISLTGFFRKYPKFGVFFFGLIMLFYGYSLINNFGYQVAVSKGGGNAEMGVAMAISALSEIPVMAAFNKLLEKKHPGFWLIFAGIFVESKVVLTWLVPSIFGYYCVAALQMLGYAVFIIACVYYVNEIIDPEDRIKGQAFMALVTTASSIVSSLVGGVMIDGMGVSGTLLITSLISASGLFIMFFSVQKSENRADASC